MTPDLNALLEALDTADTALREVYRKLADDPDLAPEHESVLRELHARRLELSRHVGVAALAEWRGARAPSDGNSAEAMDAPLPASEAVLAIEPTQPAPSPAAPASNAQLAAFKTAVQSNGLGATLKGDPTVHRPWGVTLHEMMCLLGPPDVSINDSLALEDELDALDAVATTERQAQWVRLPIEIQKYWLGHLVARTRAIREHPASEGVMDRLKRTRAVYPPVGPRLRARTHQRAATEAHPARRDVGEGCGGASAGSRLRRRKGATGGEEEPAHAEEERASRRRGRTHRRRARLAAPPRGAGEDRADRRRRAQGAEPGTDRDVSAARDARLAARGRPAQGGGRRAAGREGGVRPGVGDPRAHLASGGGAGARRGEGGTGPVGYRRWVWGDGGEAGVGEVCEGGEGGGGGDWGRDRRRLGRLCTRGAPGPAV
jgi:hypothetical protein